MAVAFDEEDMIDFLDLDAAADKVEDDFFRIGYLLSVCDRETLVFAIPIIA